MTNLDEQLTAARGEAENLAGQLANLEHDLKVAVKAQDFTTAETLKVQIPPVRDAWALAEARHRALGDVINQIAERQAEQEQATREQERRRQAQAQYDAAIAAEAEADAEIRRQWADVAPGLDAVRASMRAAVAAEGRALAARQAAKTAQVVLGEVEPARFVAGPNYASARIEQDRMLWAIYYGRQL